MTDRTDGRSDGRAVVEQLIAAINAHDLPACGALFTDDARLVAATGRVLDRDGMGRLLQGTLRTFPDAEVHVKRWIIDGEMVVTEEGRVVGRAPDADSRPPPFSRGPGRAELSVSASPQAVLLIDQAEQEVVGADFTRLAADRLAGLGHRLERARRHPRKPGRGEPAE